MSRVKRMFHLLIALLVMGVIVSGIAHAQVPAAIIINYPELKDVDDALQVGLYFTVTDSGGRVVPEARVQSARIQMDDGEIVNPADVEQPETPFYITLVLDASGSMSGAANAMRQAAIQAVNDAPENARFSVIGFNENVSLLQEFTDDRNRAINAIGNVQPINLSGTCLYDAAYTAVNDMAKAPPGRRAIILFTDGKDEVLSGDPCSQHSFEDVVGLANQPNSRVPIHTIGMSTRQQNINSTELRNMASQTGGLSAIGEQDQLGSLFQIIMDGLKSQWLAKGLFCPLAGQHTVTLTVTLEDGTILSAVTIIDVPRDCKVPITPSATPTPIVIALDIISARFDLEQEMIYLEVSLQGEQIIDRYRFDFFDADTNQLLDQQILPKPLQSPVALPAERLSGDIRVELRALDRDGNFLRWPGQRDDLIDLTVHEFAVLRPTPTPLPASPTAIPVEVELSAISYDQNSDIISLDLILTGEEQMETLEINVLDADTNLRVSVYPNIRPEATVNIRAQNLEPLKEYIIYIEAESIAGRVDRSNAQTFIYTPILTPTPTPTPSPTVTPSPTATATDVPLVIGIEGITTDEGEQNLIIKLVEVADERIVSYQLQLRDSRTGLVLGEFVHTPPPYEIIIPFANLGAGEYSAILRAMGPGGTRLIEAEPLNFAIVATPTPVPTLTPTITPTPTSPPEPGPIDRVTDAVRDNPALTIVVAVIAFVLLVLLITLIRPRKKQSTGTDFLSAQTGFYQMPSPGEVSPPAAAGSARSDKTTIDEPDKTDVFSGTLVPASELVIRRSPSMGRIGPRVMVLTVPFYIGRSVEDPNSLSLDEDTSVSRKHAEITYENGAFYVIDKGSSNGTYINNTRLTPNVPTRIQSGTKIIFGKNTEVTFRTSEPANGDKTYIQDDPDRTDYVDMNGH